MKTQASVNAATLATLLASSDAHGFDALRWVDARAAFRADGRVMVAANRTVGTADLSKLFADLTARDEERELTLWPLVVRHRSLIVAVEGAPGDDEHAAVIDWSRFVSGRGW